MTVKRDHCTMSRHHVMQMPTPGKGRVRRVFLKEVATKLRLGKKPGEDTGQQHMFANHSNALGWVYRQM